MSASFCPQCGAKLLPDAKFCSKCGTTIENKPAETQTQVPTSGFCAKCGSPLLVGAVCCSKCGADVSGKPENPAQNAFQQPMQSVAQQLQANAFSQTAPQIRNAVGQLSQVTNAPSQGGQIAFDIADSFFGTVGKGIGIVPKIIAGLSAGGLSFAAIWNAESPIAISAIISASAVVIRIMIGLIRRAKR